ncbi:MAG: hypothetical protein ACR2L6_04425 [Gemmatimonadaceae bacterium]
MRSLLLLATAVTLAGCAAQPVATAPVTAGEQFNVRLFREGNNELKYFLSEPAYLALFHVAPDGRATLLHPNYREKPAISKAGLKPLRPRGVASALLNAFLRGEAIGRVPRPSSLYLIASKAPLPLESIENSLRRGPRTLLETEVADMIARLETLAVGALRDDEWSSDLFRIWPEGPMSPTPSVPRNGDKPRRVAPPEVRPVPATPGSPPAAATPLPTRSRS